jgi:hypothetical protein
VISFLDGSGLPVAGEVSWLRSHASIAERSYVWLGVGVGLRLGSGVGFGHGAGLGLGVGVGWAYLAVHGEDRVSHQLIRDRADE